MCVLDVGKTMEAIKLQHLNVHAAVSSPYSLVWSEDDKLAVTTVEGVNILVFDPDPQNDKWKFTFKRSSVALSTKNPSTHIDINTSDIASTADRLDVYNVVLDAPIVPNLNGLSPNPAQPTMVAWSPAGTLSNSRCVLATVDVFGQANIVIPDVAGTHEIIDLTALWFSHCKKEWPEVEDTATARLEHLLARSAQLRTTAVAWAPRQESDEVTGLVMSQRDGSVVWLEMNRAGDVSYVSVTSPALGIATTLLAMSGRRVVVGGFDGRITLVTITGEVTPLWADADRVAVSWIHHLQDLTAVVAIKGNFFVAVSLDDSGTAAEAIDSVYIGGAVALDECRIALATQSGALVLATASRCDGGLAVKVDPISSPDGLPGTCGLARSRNAALWTVLTSHVDCHDCTPTQLTFFHIPALTENPVSAVISAQSVWKAQDQLELLRSLRMYQRTAELPLLAHLSLPPMPTSWDDLPPALLRVWRWLTMSQAALETRVAKKDECPITAFPYNKRHPLYKEVLRIEHLLTLDNCCWRVAAYIKKAEELTSKEKLSLSLMRQYLLSVVETPMKTETEKKKSTAKKLSKARLSETSDCESVQPDGHKSASHQAEECGQPNGGKKSKSARNSKARTVKGEPKPETQQPAESDEALRIDEERESWVTRLGSGPALDRVLETLAFDVPFELPLSDACALCNADTTVASASTAVCAFGHTLPRCALSLRQVLQVPYLLCARCDLMALPDVEVAPVCIFCDAPLELLAT